MTALGVAPPAVAEQAERAASDAIELACDIRDGDTAAVHRRLFAWAADDPLRLVQVCCALAAAVPVEEASWPQLTAWTEPPMRVADRRKVDAWRSLNEQGLSDRQILTVLQRLRLLRAGGGTTL